jgi:hydroxymethylpyrimidine pyrophosphatase-like HAD family hydrolase
VRYHILATDYDGTIATDGHVDEPTLASLERLRASGRKLVLVTGRELEDLLHVFPQIQLFERVVAENGALIYTPATREERLIGEPPSPELVAELTRRGVAPISVGRVIVATWEPHQNTVFETIHDLNLELQVIFNKGAVMVLPSGVNKAIGLRAALEEMGFSMHNAVAVGDAENDHAFLSACECGVAVANALNSIKERVDFVTEKDHGAGVTQLIDRIIESDLSELVPKLGRHAIPIGQRGDGDEWRIQPYSRGFMIAGPSESGKSTIATAFIERLAAAGYQFCIADPEGDYQNCSDAICLRGADAHALVEETLEVLAKPAEHAVVALADLPLEDRPAFFSRLFPKLLELRARTARPHWIVIDEAHHLLPVDWRPAHTTLPAEMSGLVLVTMQPDHVAAQAASLLDAAIVVGVEPQRTLAAFAKAVDVDPPPGEVPELAQGEAVVWLARERQHPFTIRVTPPESARRRHRRKYAQGKLDRDQSFYFRGPDGKLNLRAQNLALFAQMAEGVDDGTWLHHLRRGDYSQWFRTAIKDEELAQAAADVEAARDLSAAETRARIRSAIEDRYTGPP